MASVLDKYASATPSGGSVLDKYVSAAPSGGSVLDKYSSKPLQSMMIAPDAGPQMNPANEVLLNSGFAGPQWEAIKRVPEAVLGSAMNTALLIPRLGAGLQALADPGYADYAQSQAAMPTAPLPPADVYGPRQANGFAYKFVPSEAGVGGPVQATEEGIAEGFAREAAAAREARDTYGMSVLRDAAFTGLLPTGAGFAANVGIPALMQATRAEEYAGKIGEALQPLAERGSGVLDKYLPGAAGAAVQTALSPEMMKGYLQAGLMLPGAFPKGAGQNRRAEPASALENPGLGPQVPIGEAPAAPGPSLAGAGLEALARVPGVKKVLDYVTPEKKLLERRLQRDRVVNPEAPPEQQRTASPEEAHAARLALHETPRDIYALADIKANMIEDALAAHTPAEARLIGDMLTSLPKQTLALNQKRQQDLLSDVDYRSRYKDYYDQAKAMADSLYPAGDTTLPSGKPYAGEAVKDTYAHLSAMQRVAEDIGGKDQTGFFNYKKTAAELAPVNAQEAVLRQNPSNYLNQASQERASGQERLIRDKAQLRDVQRTLRAQEEPGAAERVAKWQKAKADLEAAVAGQPKVVSPIETPASPLAGESRGTVLKALSDQRVVNKALREAKLAELRGKPAEVPEIVRPTAAETAAFKPERQAMKPTGIVSPEGKELVSLPETAPGERTRTIFESPEGRGPRPAVLPPQPVEAAPGQPRIMTPAEYRAKQQQIPALEAKAAKVKDIVDAAGLDAPQRKMLVHIDALQRKIDQNRPLNAAEHKAMLDLEQTLSKRLAQRRPVEDQYIAAVTELQRNYTQGGSGYKKNVYASTLEGKYPSAEVAKAQSLSGGGARQALRRRSEGFSQREGALPGEQPLRDPSFGAPESLLQNYRLYAFDKMEAQLKATPFIRKAASPEVAKALEKAGWVKLPEDSEIHGGLAGHWMAPEVFEDYQMPAQLRDPNVLSANLAAANGWMAGNKAARNWSAAVGNGMGMGFQAFTDIGIPMWDLPGLFKASNAKNDPVFGQDVQKLGLSTIVQDAPRVGRKFDVPEPTSAGFAKEPPQPIPSLADVKAAREASLARQKPLVSHLTDAVDNLMALQADLVKKASGSETAGAYMSPKKMGEVFRNIETNVRENAYLWLRQRGVSHQEAAQRIRDAFVDYSDKSQFVKDLETYVVGGAGNRFAQFASATTARYAHLLSNQNVSVMMRAAALPVAIALLNQGMERERAKKAVLKDRYPQADLAEPSVVAAMDAAEAKKDPSYGKAVEAKHKAQNEEFARLEAPYLAGANHALLWQMGDDEQGRPVRLSLNRVFPYAKGFDIATGLQNAFSSTAPDRGRNAALALVGPGMALGPVAAAMVNMDPFTRQSIFVTNKDGSATLPLTDPLQQRALLEFLGNQYLPEQAPGGRRFNTAARLLRDEGTPSTSVRGARGLLQDQASTMFSDLTAMRMNKLDPEVRKYELAKALEAQDQGSSSLVTAPGMTQSEREAAALRGYELYKKKKEAYFGPEEPSNVAK